MNQNGWNSPLRLDCDPATDAIRGNIDTIVELERSYMRQRSLADRVTDAIANFAGSMTFVLMHAAGFGLWFFLNAGIIIEPFDPYPYQFLVLWVSLEAIFLSTFVLMKQNRMGQRAEQRSHLDLQINILAEREMTLVLQMLQRITAHLGVDDDMMKREVEQLASETPLKALAEELEQKLPNNE